VDGLVRGVLRRLVELRRSQLVGHESINTVEFPHILEVVLRLLQYSRGAQSLQIVLLFLQYCLISVVTPETDSSIYLRQPGIRLRAFNDRIINLKPPSCPLEV
jgi:hypothetical protein